MLNYVICDDNKSILDKLSKILESLFIKHNLDAEISGKFTSPKQLLEFVKSNTVNVLFLDIDLKSNVSGIDLASEIRKWNKDIYIIFTSAHLEYILIAYKCKTFDFIPKPLTTERVEETILRLMDDINNDGKKNSFIRIDNKNTIINQNNINFIKKEGMKLVFYTDTRKYETYSSFTKISSELPANFIRCHKSFIANINKISDINMANNTIDFENINEQCYIGPKYKNNLMEVLKNDGIFTNGLA